MPLSQANADFMAMLAAMGAKPLNEMSVDEARETMGAFKAHIGVNFFNGVALKPQPSGGEGKGMRSVRIESLEDLDEKQLRDWIKQAAKNPGWGKV